MDLYKKSNLSKVEHKEGIKTVIIVLKTSIADTGAQCFLLGINHLHGLGLDVSSLLQSEINLNCANSTAAGNLGVFFAKVRGEHHETEEVVESRMMVYVIEGDIILLVSNAVLETLGRIPKSFPQVGQFLPDMMQHLLGELLRSTRIPS
jgi:hypothetical protein